VSQHKRHIENEFIARGTTLSYLLSKIAREGLESEKLELIEKAAFIIQAEDVTTVHVYTDLWDLIESYPENAIYKDSSLKDAMKHFNNYRTTRGSGISDNSFYIRKHSEYYCFFHRVMFQPYEKAVPITIGYVMVDMSTQHLQETTGQMIKSNIIAALFITIITVLALHILIGRIIGKPIMDIHSSVRKFKEGTVSEIKTSHSTDEIGDLAREFNEMSRTIKEKVEALRLAAKVMESALEGIFITDSKFNITAVNPSFKDITGLPYAEVKGRNPAIMAAGHYDIEIYRQVLDAVKLGRIWQGEIKNRRKNGEAYITWMNISAIKDNDGNITNYVGVFTDITQRKLTEDHLKRAANYDMLTDLPNKSLFRELLGHSLEQAKRDRKKLAVMFLDIDNFKPVNDTYGHDIGDLLLHEVAQRLKECVRQSDIVSRLSGDEFAVILGQIGDISNAVFIAQKILLDCSHPFYLAGNEIKAGISIGISLYPENGADAEALLKNADEAMYLAKNSGKNNYRFFSERTDSSSDMIK
jgi:diguanylate cyclase (GGDEF)-like protein/PAS domain S-box-containing protein